jgi:hypothetical protein
VRHDLPLTAPRGKSALSYPAHGAIRNGRFNPLARANTDKA